MVNNLIKNKKINKLTLKLEQHPRHEQSGIKREQCKAIGAVVEKLLF